MTTTFLRLLSEPDAPHDDAPSSVLPAAATAQALAFLESFTELATGQWRAMARAREQRQHNGGARRALAAMLEDPALAWPVWEVRDAIDTVAHVLAHGALRALALAERRELVRSALADAALAVLLRDRLCASHFEELYAPFAPVLPLGEFQTAS